MTRPLFILIIFLFGSSCSILPPFSYDLCVALSEQSSKLSSNQLIGIEDTTKVKLSVQIQDNNSLESGFLGYAFLQNKEEKIVSEQVIDSLGQFHFKVNPGQYTLSIMAMGYTDLDTSLCFEPGEVRNLTVTLGTSGGFMMYQIKSWKRLSMKELNDIAIDLSHSRSQINAK